MLALTEPETAYGKEIFMTYKGKIHARHIFICSLLLFCISALSGHAAEVNASPASITFESPDQKAAIQVSAGGQPVSITGHRLMASGHTYNHMIDFRADQGSAAVSPTDSAEIGSYTLVIETAAGAAHVKVYTPLSKLANSLEQRAAAMNMSIGEYRKHLGISGTILEERIDLNLPPVVYAGQTVSMPLTPEPGRTYTWKIDGKTVHGSGPSGAVFEYTFTKPGEYLISLTEKENGRVTAAAADFIQAVPEPPVTVEGRIYTRFNFKAPAGYERTVWTVDGDAAGTEPVWSGSWKTPGVHTVELQATHPVSKSLQPMRINRWRVEVTQQ
jgi:hypothetical protein